MDGVPLTDEGNQENVRGLVYEEIMIDTCDTSTSLRFFTAEIDESPDRTVSLLT
jgi:hypothetical protein